MSKQGRRQKLKSGMELDFLYARGLYCYLTNCQGLKHYIKKQLNRRYRHELHSEMINEVEYA
jgi:hypothetical protein